MDAFQGRHFTILETKGENTCNIVCDTSEGY